MSQLCRVCGDNVPSGFTNCDSCYYSSDEARVDETKIIKRISKIGKSQMALYKTFKKQGSDSQFRERCNSFNVSLFA